MVDSLLLLVKPQLNTFRRRVPPWAMRTCSHMPMSTLRYTPLLPVVLALPTLTPFLELVVPFPFPQPLLLAFISRMITALLVEEFLLVAAPRLVIDPPLIVKLLKWRL
jgi:sterol desaturase/sphingolipid hydroxylase (fatty acid hydroxylase superfamily)